MQNCEQHRDSLTAWLDGALEGDAAAAFDRHATSCTACRDERHWLEQVSADLAFLGSATVAQLPAIDIVDAVLAAVERAERKPQVVPFAPRPRMRLSWAWASAGLAAAAVLVFAWWLMPRQPSSPGTQQMASPGVSHPNEPVPPGGQSIAPESATPATPSSAQSESMGALLADAKRSGRVGAPNKQFALPDLAAVTVANVLQARREGDGLGQNASLSVEQARAAIAAANASRQAVIAASRFLPPAEANAVLEKAVAQSPDDAYARLTLAQALSAQPERYADAARELERVSELDPDNALPDYLLARNALAAGDVETALAALRAADGKAEVQSYSTSAAQYRHEALTQLGMADEAALLLSALTAGVNEYDALTGLSDDLLKYAEDYEAAGQTTLAQQIYEAAFRLGDQVYQGALFGIEQLAGLDVQRAAADSLSGIYAALNDQGQLDWLARQVNGLFEPFRQVAAFFSNLDGFFQTSVNEANAPEVARQILDAGDLTIAVNPQTP